MNISEILSKIFFQIPEPYLTVVKIALMGFIFGSAGNLARYIYYDL